MRGRLLHLTCAIAGALIVASMATAWAADLVAPEEGQGEPEPASSDAQEADEHAEDPHGHGGLANASDRALGTHQPRHDHALSNRSGEVPTRAEARELPHHFENFVVRGNEGLAEMAEAGYIEGEGTLEDPYVIDGFRVEDDLWIKDTSRPLVVENSYVEGQLTLNFVGEHVYVHHNYVEDLRVNENVEREGPTTAGLFEHNEIAFIGQLRHFSGTFAHNDVGPRPDGVLATYLSDTGPARVPDDLVWNFDGYHGAHVHNNTVEGLVDVKLHGHFHGSCLACDPHEHHDREDFPDEDMDEQRSPRSRHSYRHHTLDFENNAIRAPDAERALRFYDRNHAGDDRTANSEPNFYLEDRHEHHAYLRVAHNTIREGSLVFDVVNAEDERHAGLVQETRIDLQDNDLSRERPRGQEALVPAYVVHAADNARLDARANAYTFDVEDTSAPGGYGWIVEGQPAPAAGFVFHEVNASRLSVQETEGANTSYGVLMDGVRDNTPLVLADNRFDASEENRRES